MTEEIKFSLIISVYNIEEYIEKSINSILKQSYKNYEIIIVNDGSTDKSIDKISMIKDGRIRIYNKDNGGVSSAKNYGINYISGDYIWFIDGDDYISENALKDFYDILNKQDIDILCIKNYLDYNGKLKTKNARYYNSFKNDKILSTVSSWSKIYKTSFFKKNNFKFLEGRIYEDLELTPYTIAKTNKIFYLDKEEYYYVQRAGSIMNQSHSFNINRDDKFIVLESLLNRFKNDNIYDKYKSELEYIVIRHLVLVYSTEILLFPKKIFKNRCQKVLKFLNSLNAKWENNIYLKQSPIYSRVFVKFYRNKLFFICKFFIFLKNKFNR